MGGTDGEEPAAPSGVGGETTFARAERDYVRREYVRKVALTQRVCRRIAAGETIAAICRDPDMPTRSTFIAWLAAHPELRGLAEAATADAAGVFGPRRAYHRWDEAVAREFLERIEDGRGLREVCAEPDMPVHATITRWLKQRPSFAAAYRLAREAQADRLFDLAWRIACEATEDTVKTARLKIQTIRWRTGRLAPRVYGPQKAAAPAEDDGEAAEAGVQGFVLRRYGKTADGRMIEITDLVQGLTDEEDKALRADLREGRVRLEDLPPPPAWLGSGKSRLSALS